jgi:hypothetical protein
MNLQHDPKAIDEALYALNRAINPDPEHRSYTQELLVQARDKVWEVITTIDPSRKD